MAFFSSLYKSVCIYTYIHVCIKSVFIYTYIYIYIYIYQVHVFIQRPRNGQIKLCNCANREINLNKLCRIGKQGEQASYIHVSHMHTYMYTHMCIYIHTYMYVHTLTQKSVCTYIDSDHIVNVCIYTYIYIHICIYLLV